MRTLPRPPRLLGTRFLGAVVAATMVAACTGTTEPTVDQVPVVVAESVPFAEAGLEPRPVPPEPEPTVEPSPLPELDPSVEPSTEDDVAVATGPTSGDAARFAAADDPEGVSGLQHVVVDLDGDGVSEVVATGMRDGTGIVRVAWWNGSRYEVLADDEAGRGNGVEDLRVGDVNRDGTTELLVVVEGDGLKSLALWAVPGAGELARLEAVGGCHDGNHVYGVTRARLVSQTDAPPAIVADCDESPLRRADWAEHRWLWQDGAYRLDEPEPEPEPEPSDPDDDGSPDDDNPGQGDGPPEDAPGNGLGRGSLTGRSGN